jgi:hypothetical protein
MPRVNRPRPEAPTARPFRPPRSAGGVLPPRGLFVEIACAGDRHLRLCHQEEGQSIQNFPFVSSSRLHLRLSTPVLPEFLNPVNRHIRSRIRVVSPSIRLRIRMPLGGSISRPWIQVDRKDVPGCRFRSISMTSSASRVRSRLQKRIGTWSVPNSSSGSARSTIRRNRMG